MIGGPSQKPRGSKEVSPPPAEGSQPKRPRLDSAAAASEPREPAATAPSAAVAPAATQAAMELPVSRKQKYPGAPATDLDAAKRADFARMQASHLRERLPKAGLSLVDFLGPKRAGDVAREESLRADQQQAKADLQAVCPEAVDVALNLAIRVLLAPTRARAGARTRLDAAQRDLTAAQQVGAQAAVHMAEATVAARRTELEAAEGAVQRATPPWARGAEANAALHKTVASTARLRAQEFHNNRHLRVTWVQLGARTLTKLPHFTQGTFGKVMLAMRTDDKSLRALKTLRMEPSKKAGSTQVTELAEAQQEVAYMQRFYDPDVTLTHDPQTQKLTIDMPLALGSLNHVPQHDVALVRSTGRQVFERLATMHGEGVLHNDLKPANINVHADGRVLPADFGKAGTLEEGNAVGTYAYGAPGAV